MPLLDTLFNRAQADNKLSVPQEVAGGGRSVFGASRGTPLSSESWLAKALARPDPLMQFDWDVSIAVNGLAHRPEYVENVVVPGIQTASEPVFRSGSKIYVATTYEVGAVSVRLYEDVQMLSTKFLRTWFGLIHENNGDHGLPAKYKGSIVVIPRTPRGEDIAQITCVGVFPTTHPPLTFGSDNERQVLDVEFSCDFVKIEFIR